MQTVASWTLYFTLFPLCYGAALALAARLFPPDEAAREAGVDGPEATDPGLQRWEQALGGLFVVLFCCLALMLTVQLDGWARGAHPPDALVVTISPLLLALPALFAGIGLAMPPLMLGTRLLLGKAWFDRYNQYQNARYQLDSMKSALALSGAVVLLAAIAAGLLIDTWTRFDEDAIAHDPWWSLGPTRIGYDEVGAVTWVERTTGGGERPYLIVQLESGSKLVYTADHHMQGAIAVERDRAIRALLERKTGRPAATKRHEPR